LASGGAACLVFRRWSAPPSSGTVSVTRVVRITRSVPPATVPAMCAWIHEVPRPRHACARRVGTDGNGTTTCP
jgi:hypothetical protein